MVREIKIEEIIIPQITPVELPTPELIGTFNGIPIYADTVLMLAPNTPVRISGRRTALGNAPEPAWTGRIIHAYPDIQEYLVQPDTDDIPRQVRHEHVKPR